ncbi:MULTISPECIES: histidine phosphatase family protein [unclassified Methylobacterium]|uniref:histidine phosphatase family protein n=1 Tax=unclassified Methylobacterium TaxID=2615210 RepID=UPI0011C206FA|nr:MULTISPECIES: histidine phosphatase family protein [unclassified Methylobacterium]QEE38308.1 histidine phosphatase family protein [Methylobacterium sp. WL1]TXN57479.1 histidine phosphatase family protein [Methylobacterium sp. WL2]
MPETTRIVCIRHGESTFNAAHRHGGGDPGLLDARLTPRGQAQARDARERLKDIPFELVVISPLTRAIETAAILFGEHPNQPRVLVEVLHRECQESSCDVGRAASEIAAEFPHLDVGHLPEVWWHAEPGCEVGGYPVEPRHLFDARVAGFREWLRGRPETTIAVVGHGTFFYHLTGTFLENCASIELDLAAEPVLA